MVPLSSLPTLRALAACCLAALPARALPPAPATITPVPSSQSGAVALSWTAVPGATGYTVKRGTSPAAATLTLGTVTTTTFTDPTATPGVFSYYTVTATDPSGESPATRGVMAAPAVIVDNGGPGTSSTGSWSTSFLAGYFGTQPVFAGPVAGSTPTATYTFTPDLPSRGNYDVYLRWTTDPNRATNTPVDLDYTDGQRTFSINQELNHGTWVLLTSLTAEAGTTASLTIRNNGANGNVIADAVQFVPRHAPWAPTAEPVRDYTLLTVDEHFDGTALDTTAWSTFAGRGEHSVSDGRLHTNLRYKGSVPIESATTADLADEANWAEGGIIAKHAQKFGYHEARLRLPQLPARGVDIAYWHSATDEILHGYEIDAPEFFHKDSSGVSNNYGFGVWDHFAPTRPRPGLAPGRTWDHHENYSALGDLAEYVTIGLEWRVDNTQVVYVNGRKAYTAPASGMNDVESILPSNIILSTKVLDWLRPNAALNGTEATWDYARYYQKPGFLGAIDGDWSNAANWGPDGLPQPGDGAVFNMPGAPAAVTLSADQELQSLFLDGASLPAHLISGPGALRLGAAKPGDVSVTHGGVLVNTTVTNNQTIAAPIVGLQNLQFANLSRTPGTTLFLNGSITGDGLAPRDIDFISPLATNPALGSIVLAQPLGPGIRHVNRGGDIPFTLPSNSLHDGELRIARGPVVIPAVSSLGTTAASAVVFRPRYKHSDSWRPRLTYTGTGETSHHVLQLGGWQADGVLESTGSGPLVWSGDLSIGPVAELLTGDLTLTLGATTSSGTNVFSGEISDASLSLPDSTPAILRINKTGSGTWSLAGNNSYRGTTTLNGGTLAVSSFNSVNGGTPLLPSSSLGTPQTVEKGTIAITSGTLRYTGPGETTDRVLHLAGSSGATLDHAGSGVLKFASDLTSHAAAKTLTLTGSGNGEISGLIPDHNASNKTNLAKSGTGTWRLSGNNTYTGTTTVSAGTLVVDGSLTAGGNLNLSTSAARLTGTGTIATPSIINGTLVASPLAFTGNLTLGSFGKLLANFTANHAGGISPVAASTVTVNNGAKVDVTLNAPGSTTNFLQSWWRSPRVIPLLTATSKTGSLAIGTVSADSAGNPAATYGSFTLQQTATAVNLVWTPVPGFPDIDTPTLSLLTPAADPVSIPDTLTTLRAAVSTGGNPAVTWSQLSGPGIATFTHPAAADTGITFSAPGTYVLQVNAANALGSASTSFTVHVAPPLTMSFRQGENSYTQATTFLRGDNPAWNSGSRDQFLVGRTNAPFRGLLSFDLSSVPAGATVTAATLDLRSAGLGVGTQLETLQLHEVLVPFAEGNGDGSNAANGSGTGADWQHREPATQWSSPGAAESSDYHATPLASLAGYNPSTFSSGTALSIPSSPSFAAAAANAIMASQPLSLMLKMDADTTGSSLFTRIASDDHANPSYRPRLALTLDHDFAPSLDPGPSPSPAFGAPASLQGSVSNATTSAWTQLSGPSPATFGNPSSPATTAVFPAPGVYQLSLAATNPHGETRRTLAVTALSQLDAWRQTHFATTANSGDAADSADPDHDGHANLLEFATGRLPHTPDGSITALTKSGPTLEFTYRRSHAAVADGIAFTVEWSTTLGAGWSDAGVAQAPVPDSDDGLGQEIRAVFTVPPGTPACFVRLRVTRP